MNKTILLNILLIVALPGSAWCSGPQPQMDQSRLNQILYTGKEWHNLYSYIKGDQFLFAREFLPGSLSIYGKTYGNVSFSYDIYNDQLIIPANNGVILELNKEMIDSFSLVFQVRAYHFLNLGETSTQGLKGYVNSLYSGKTHLVVKYKKEIDLLAVDDKYDLFFQTYRIYILKDGVAHQITGKKDLMKIFQEDETQIKAFMKKNGVKVSKKNPDSFVPVLRYYDSISQ